MDLEPIVRAYDRWPRVSKDRHLEPVVGVFAVGLMHAAQQVERVADLGAISERARAPVGILFPLDVRQVEPATVAVGAASFDRKRVFVGSRNDNRHPKDEYKQPNKHKRKPCAGMGRRFEEQVSVPAKVLKHAWSARKRCSAGSSTMNPRGGHDTFIYMCVLRYVGPFQYKRKPSSIDSTRTIVGGL